MEILVVIGVGVGLFLMFKGKGDPKKAALVNYFNANKLLNSFEFQSKAFERVIDTFDLSFTDFQRNDFLELMSSAAIFDEKNNLARGVYTIDLLDKDISNAMRMHGFGADEVESFRDDSVFIIGACKALHRMTNQPLPDDFVTSILASRDAEAGSSTK